MAVSRPIFVVGGPRSGKKMTAEVLARHPQISAFPCEMTFLWRHGHRGFAYDSLTPEMLTPKIKRVLHKTFEKAATPESPRVVDRTDHNVVRLEYVREAFPDCRIIHIIRDGRGSVASAIRRRRSNPGLKYLFEKATAIPLTDLPYQGSRYGWDILQSRLGKDRYRKLWGILTPTTVQFEAHPSLAVKCAIQWRESVKAGIASQANFDGSNYLTVRYEDSVQRPVEVFREVFKFAELEWQPETEKWLQDNVHAGSVDLWKRNLTQEQLDEINPHISQLLDELGYDG